MAPVIKEIHKSNTLQSNVVSTGQHKELLNKVLADFGLDIAIDHDLALMMPRQTLASLSARAIIALDGVVKKETPDFVLVQGDTTTAFMAALVAFYYKVQVGHVEAGLRTHDIYSPFPEEEEPSRLNWRARQRDRIGESQHRARGGEVARRLLQEV